MYPDISVVVPAYNAERTLRPAVESCFRAAHAFSVEVVIVDDCSTDETFRIATELSRKFDSCSVVHNDRNMNCLESRRIGLLHCKGRVVSFLDADDCFDDGFLDACLELLDQEKADLISAPIQPNYPGGFVPDVYADSGLRSIYACPDSVLVSDDIVHAIFVDRTIVWSIVGKLFNADLLRRAFSFIPESYMFQGEDAYLMFIVAVLAGKLVSSSTLPPYLYTIGSGGSALNRSITLEQYEGICEAVRASDAVLAFLETEGSFSRFKADYDALRRALIEGMACRLLNDMDPGFRSRALDILIRATSVGESVSALASQGWSRYDLFQSFAGRNAGVHRTRDVTPNRTIALVYHSMGIGGIAELMRFLAILWQGMGFDVVLILDEGADTLDVPQGVSVDYVPDCFVSCGSKYWERGLALERVLEERNVNIVVHEQWLGQVCPWDALLAKELGINTVLHANGVFFSAFGYDIPDLVRLPLSYPIFDHVVCSSESDGVFWRQFNQNVSVTYNPINKLFFSDHIVNQNAHVVAWCGRVEPDKGVDDLLYAAREIAEHCPRVTIKVFGPCGSRYQEELLQRCRLLGIERVIEWCGEKTSKELAEEYRNVDVFLSSSLMEGWCLSIAEAKAAGLPIVMYRLPYLTLCEPETGVVTADLGNPIELGRRVVCLLSNDELRSTMSAAAQRHAKKIDSFDHLSFWNGVFTSICAGEYGENTALPVSMRMWDGLFDMETRCLKLNAAAVADLKSQLEAVVSERDELRRQISSKAGFPLRFIRKLQSIFK